MSFHVPKSIDDVARLVAEGIEESTHLDYKSSRAFGQKDKLKLELSRDISAFANADGGVIIFGVEDDGSGKPIDIIGSSQAGIDADWFEDVLLRAVQPRIPGIEVNCLGHSSGAVFVVHVPASTLAPHQAADKKFYARRQRRRDDLELHEIDLLRERNARREEGVFGGLITDHYHVSALVQNKLDQPITDVKLSLPAEFASALKRKAKLIDEGLTVVPARSSFRFRLGLVRDMLESPVLSAHIEYDFVYRIAGQRKVRGVRGQIHLAELTDSALETSDIDRLSQEVKSGLSLIASMIAKCK